MEISFSKIKSLYKSSPLSRMFTTKPKKLLNLPADLNISGSPNRDVMQVTSILPDIGTMKNNILRTKKNIIGTYKFYDNGKEIGFADFIIERRGLAAEGTFPDDWFVDGGAANTAGSSALKPYMFITELSMKDRIDKKHLIKRDKKYGAMAMQHLLTIAREKGCEGRIALVADTLGRTGFQPGRFYHKMGFSFSPNRVKFLKKNEADYMKNVELLKAKGFSYEQIEKQMEGLTAILPEKINGRYVQDSGTMFLTNPECIENYPI